jgi:hypothetical protein
MKWILLIWSLTLGLGFALLARHEFTPGDGGTPVDRWPVGGALPLDPSRPTLVLLAHPRCPCTRASLDELARIIARGPDRVAAHVVLLGPTNPRDASWTTRVAAIPDVRVWRDDGGAEARRFGAATSGHVLIFDPSGRLRFSGGITASRGHSGDNVGASAVAALLDRESDRPGPFPVFGCPLFEPGAGRPREERCQTKW